MLLECGC